MEIKTLSQSALDIIDQYIHFKAGPAICSVPYFNNKITKTRIALRVHVGKGSPDDIREELESIVLKEKIDPRSFTDELLKKTLLSNGLGIECSGFCYHILEAESIKRGYGTISKKIKFVNCHGFIGQIKCSVRPVQNCDVETFANDENSRIISLKEILPGDIITLTSTNETSDLNHILIIKEVHYENSIPKIIIYSHSIAYPEDGLYNTGVRNGTIEINNISLPITTAKWVEDNKETDKNPLFIRAEKSKTEARRLNWF